VAPLSAILSAYWLSRIARHVPDGYIGETAGGLFLNLTLLASSSGQLVTGKRARILLGVASLLFAAIAMYFVFGYQRGVDIHLPRG
jgi:Ca2+/Na+ antiporter